jgi:hypothetical protein
MNLTDYLAAHVADGTYDIKFMIKTYDLKAIRSAIGTYDLEAARAANGTYDLEAARAAIRAENAPVTHTVSPEMAAHFAKIEAYRLASYAGKRIGQAPNMTYVD